MSGYDITSVVDMYLSRNPEPTSAAVPGDQVPEDAVASHRHLCDPHLAEEVILDSNFSQGLEFFGLGCSL